jgi:hypothetical protein
MSVNGRNVYIETHKLEDYYINLPSYELSPQMRERLNDVFSTLSSNTENESSQTYITLAFDYHPEKIDYTEKYKFSGFWNQNICEYEFEYVFE